MDDGLLNWLLELDGGTDGGTEDKKDSLEARFKRCKEKVKGTGKDPWAVCAYLNPKLSPKRRAQLKAKMIAARKK